MKVFVFIAIAALLLYSFLTQKWFPPLVVMKKRGCDPKGCGAYGASRDGGTRIHKGFDVRARKGETVRAPISGMVSVFGTSTGLTGVGISNSAEKAKVIYITPKVRTGENVKRGQVIGYAQDITVVYGAEMTNHIHLESIIGGVNINPEKKLGPIASITSNA